MLQDYFKDNLNAAEAKKEVQKLTYYPITFQAARVLRVTGILEEVYKNRRKGITPQEIANNLRLPYYGVNTLLEAGLTIGLVYLKEEITYTLTKMGYHLLFDRATIVNLNFTHDVCYKAMYHLEDSIRQGLPCGLKELGVDENEKTIYPSLSNLKEPIKSSWFEFDHYYSDSAFPAVFKVVFKHPPKHIVDIGGNTGKWSVFCCNNNSDVKMTILDLPGQLKNAQTQIRDLNLEHRISGIEGNVLCDNLSLPNEADVVWMSQFLDCFSEEQILFILSNIENSINQNTTVYIMELFWDRQKDLAAAYCLHGTSLYFTTIANGNSKMYHSRDMIKLIEKAGLEVILDEDQIGEFHTLLKCKKRTCQ